MYSLQRWDTYVLLFYSAVNSRTLPSTVVTIEGDSAKTARFSCFPPSIVVIATGETQEPLGGKGREKALRKGSKGFS